MKLLQERNYLKAIAGRTIIEAYSHGRMAIVFDLYVDGEVDMKSSALGRNGVTVSTDRHTILILHDNSNNAGAIDYWQDEAVFVDNVEFVKNGDVPISTGIWLYSGDHVLEEEGLGDVYFSAPKRRFKFRRRASNGELGIPISDSPSNSDPSVVQSGFDVVNRIPCDKGYSLDDVNRIREFVLNRMRPTLGIDLDAGNIAIWQRGYNPIQVNDVLLGPIQLESCAIESGHV